MNKQEFLNNLKNCQIPALKNREELNMLPESDFQPFDASEPISLTFTPSYFYKQYSRLNNANFSKQRCEHLIDVKEKMQKDGVEGFGISKQNQESCQDMSQMQKTLDKFKPKADFQAAIDDQKVDLVRAFILRDLNSEYLDASDVKDLVLYTQTKLPETFELYETDTKFRKPFNTNKVEWNYDYFITQQNPLDINFALERVLHLVDVRDFLRKEGVPEFQKLILPASETESSSESHKGRQRSEARNQIDVEARLNSVAKKALMIGGGILALVALAIAILK